MLRYQYSASKPAVFKRLPVTVEKNAVREDCGWMPASASMRSLADRLDLGRVRGVVDVDPAGAQVQIGTECDEFLECRDLARHHHRRRAVDGGDSEPIAVGRQ